MDLALNNLQRLICHKTNQTKPNNYGAYDVMVTVEGKEHPWTRLFAFHIGLITLGTV